MDYRNILAFGFVLLCGAVFVQSFNFANAYPQGPNISLGSNPVENFYGSASSLGSLTFQNDFIVTTLLSNSTSCNPTIDGVSFFTGTGTNSIFFYRYTDSANSPFTTGNATLKIQAGSSLSLGSCGDVHISGYYVHP